MLSNFPSFEQISKAKTMAEQEKAWLQCKLIFREAAINSLKSWPKTELQVIYKCGSAGFSLRESVDISQEYVLILNKLHLETIATYDQAELWADKWLCYKLSGKTFPLDINRVVDVITLGVQHYYLAVL